MSRSVGFVDRVLRHAPGCGDELMKRPEGLGNKRGGGSPMAIRGPRAGAAARAWANVWACLKETWAVSRFGPNPCGSDEEQQPIVVVDVDAASRDCPGVGGAPWMRLRRS